MLSFISSHLYGEDPSTKLVSLMTELLWLRVERAESCLGTTIISTLYKSIHFHFIYSWDDLNTLPSCWRWIQIICRADSSRISGIVWITWRCGGLSIFTNKKFYNLYEILFSKFFPGTSMNLLLLESTVAYFQMIPLQVFVIFPQDRYDHCQDPHHKLAFQI